jgi:hypothetical protein
MSTTDNFWSELRQSLKQAASMAPVAASRTICDFIDRHYDRWCAKQTETDRERNPDLCALHDRAWDICKAPTAEATARWEREYSARWARDQEVCDLANDLYYAARAGRAAAEYISSPPA